jgi:Sec7-like guanine-nucleotide exchange factor
VAIAMLIESVLDAELDFDSSMRMFLQSFRLPGESQKIARMMEKFSTAYHKVSSRLSPAQTCHMPR